MKKGELYLFYKIVIVLYALFTIRAFLQKATWFLDGMAALVGITLIYLLAKKLKIGKTEFILINVWIMTHLLGFFGLYAWGTKLIQYDNIVHFVTTIVIAWVVFNFFVKTFERNIEVRKLFNKHLFFLMFLVVSIATTTAFVGEITEFGGFLFFGEGDGLFFMGDGDYNGKSIYGDYTDTMDDIITNIIGAVVGAFIYYFVRYKKLAKISL